MSSQKSALESLGDAGSSMLSFVIKNPGVLALVAGGVLIAILVAELVPFLQSPLGKSLTKAFRGIGAVMLWAANHPLWALLGGGALFVFGSLALQLGSRVIRALNDRVGRLIENEDKLEGASEAVVDIVVADFVVEEGINVADLEPNGAGAQDAAELRAKQQEMTEGASQDEENDAADIINDL